MGYAMCSRASVIFRLGVFCLARGAARKCYAGRCDPVLSYRGCICTGIRYRGVWLHHPVMQPIVSRSINACPVLDVASCNRHPRSFTRSSRCGLPSSTANAATEISSWLFGIKLKRRGPCVCLPACSSSSCRPGLELRKLKPELQ